MLVGKETQNSCFHGAYTIAGKTERNKSTSKIYGTEDGDACNGEKESKRGVSVEVVTSNRAIREASHEVDMRIGA